MRFTLGPLEIVWETDAALNREAERALKNLHEQMARGSVGVGGEHVWVELESLAFLIEGKLWERDIKTTSVIPWSIIRYRKLGRL